MTGGDRGSGTVLVLALSSVVVLLGVLLASLAAVGVARHQAASAADLAALAAADRALSGAETACAAASRAAGAGAATLTRCVLTGDVAQVEVMLRPEGPLGQLGAARATARAGPGERPSAPPRLR